MKRAVSYDDVLLVPHYSDINSRIEVNLGNALDEHIYLDIPIISSPMDTITESKMASTIARAGGLGIIHRYNNVWEQTKLVRDAVSCDLSITVGAAVGVTGDYFQRSAELIDSGAEVLCIDMAHGHHVLMERAVKTLKDRYGELVHIMAGNIATAEGYEHLSTWGADSVRCGIGGGSICSTRIETGHGVPTLQTVLDCAALDLNAKVIADGGLKSSGDIVKALAAGADFVMVGSLLGGTTEAPGKTIAREGRRYKEYRGMASREAKMVWRQDSSYSEGVSSIIPHKGEVTQVLERLRQGIASGFSYSGARNIEELWSKAEFVIQTTAGRLESSTHILNR